jgi:Na+-transporting methylmalonyl-CoA/oxaloacetate decarboxylase gamma subunit
MGVIFFVLFIYNFIRWRMARMLQRMADDTTEPPPQPKVIHREYDPAFDFSEPEAADAKSKETGIIDKGLHEGIVDPNKKKNPPPAV